MLATLAANKEQIIACIIYILIAGILGYAANLIRKLREDKNSFYSKQIEFLEEQREVLKKQLSKEEYNNVKVISQDIIYKVEQLGKELGWDAVTKHSKAAELISAATGLSDEEIFNIIKTTIGMMNINKQSNAYIQNIESVEKVNT